MKRFSNIVLIGMPASGKSTIGVLAAKRLAMSFIDTDVCIQSSQEMSLQQIIDNKGVEQFLQIEQQHLTSINAENTVIATGGSAVYSEKAINKLKNNGIVIYLKLPLEQIKQRLTNLSTRGVVIEKEQTLEALYTQRKPLYENYADITIDCSGLSHGQLVEEISQIHSKFCS